MFEHLKPLPSTLCYLSLARAAKSQHGVCGGEESSTEWGWAEKYCHQRGWKKSQERKKRKADKKKNWHWKNASPGQSIFRLAAEMPLRAKGRGSLMWQLYAQAYTGLTKKQTTIKKSHFSLLSVGNNLLQFTGTTVQKFIACSQREPFTHPAEQERWKTTQTRGVFLYLSFFLSQGQILLLAPTSRTPFCRSRSHLGSVRALWCPLHHEHLMGCIPLFPVMDALALESPQRIQLNSIQTNSNLWSFPGD